MYSAAEVCQKKIGIKHACNTQQHSAVTRPLPDCSTADLKWSGNEATIGSLTLVLTNLSVYRIIHVMCPRDFRTTLDLSNEGVQFFTTWGIIVPKLMHPSKIMN